MITVTADTLLQIMPSAGAARAALFADPLNAAMSRFQISTNEDRTAAFLAQVAHESQCLTHLEENLNYSEEGLLETWASHFDAKLAAEYAHDAVRIGNRAYAGRDGNGDEASGDGYRYRGRGLFGITGKANYEACGKGIGYDLVNSPNVLTIAGPAALSAAWFWAERGLNALADSGNFVGITQRINGGQNGAKARLAFLVRAENALGCRAPWAGA